jgi:anthranilate phosphoribosyltransferase
MESVKENKLSALAQGVKLIGIGKHGSKKLPDQLIVEITNELKLGSSPALLIGTFFGALMMKDIEPSYLALEEYSGKGSLTNTSIMWDNLFADTPSQIKSTGIKLLSKETLNEEEAKVLGLFLFSDEKCDTFRGMAASVLRIRYETDDEYKGLYNAIIEKSVSITTSFDNKTVIQLAEPFDGVEHSYMITPILASELQQQGYSVVVTCGRSSGPKKTLNTWDIYKTLNANFLTTDKNTASENHCYGWALDQKYFFPELDKWVDKRRVIMKRPFLATLEKVLNPAKADILITSVFHIPYLEKMIELGFMAGFNAVIVLKRGLEGSLAPSLSKATGILCAVKLKDGSSVTQNFDANNEHYSNFKSSADNIVDPLQLTSNIEYIRHYLIAGKTDDTDFDMRVKLAIALYNEGLEWIKKIQEATKN